MIRFYKGNKEGLEDVFLLDSTKNLYGVIVLKKDYTPTETEIKRHNKDKRKEQSLPDIEYGIIESNGNTVTDIKNAVIKAIEDYDSSTYVNTFIHNGRKYWLDKTTRMSLLNDINVLKNLKEDTITVWLNSTTSVNLPLDTTIDFLNELEVYAMNCYNVTKNHIKDITGMDDYESLSTYNFITGYPKYVELKETKE